MRNRFLWLLVPYLISSNEKFFRLVMGGNNHNSALPEKVSFKVHDTTLLQVSSISLRITQ